MPIFLEVCAELDIPDGRPLSIEVDGTRVAVYRVEGEVYALSGRCPHANGPMGLGWIEEGEAVCPLHRWRFRLKTGRCSTVRGESIPVYPCEVRAGRVWVGL